MEKALNSSAANIDRYCYKPMTEASHIVMHINNGLHSIAIENDGLPIYYSIHSDYQCFFNERSESIPLRQAIPGIATLSKFPV